MKKADFIAAPLVADAASMGLHWIYDFEHLQKVAGKDPLFSEPESENYQIDKAFEAHQGKKAGELSHYGFAMLVALGAYREGFYRNEDFRKSVVEHYGEKSGYDGYLDKATKGSLANLKAHPDKTMSGADDRQCPALQSLPAFCFFEGDKKLSDVLEDLEDAVRVTNNNDEAVDYLRFCYAYIRGLEGGQGPEQALEGALPLCSEKSRKTIKSGLEQEYATLKEASLGLGQNCNLECAVPLSLWIEARTESFEEALTLNTLAGGDSCGRALFLGIIAAFKEKGLQEDHKKRLRLPKAFEGQLGILL